MNSVESIFQLPDFEALKALQLYIKHHIEGLMIGMHQSPKRGFGIEFKEYRNYVAGDSLKQLDWKYFARTDHYVIKEAEMEKQQEFVFVLDQSLSMNFKMNGVSKLNWARTLIAALAYLANNQHDKFYIFKQENPINDLEGFLYQLIQLETQNVDFEDLRPIKSFQNKSTVFIFTDAYADKRELSSLLKDWSAASQEVILLHLFFENEEKLDFKGKSFTFKDLETQKTVEVNSQETISDYQNKLTSWQNDLKESCWSNGIAYWRLKGSENIQEAVLKLLNHFNNSW